MNNRTLLIVFIAALFVFLGSKLFRGKRAGSFDPEIVQIDSSKVDRLAFVSAGAQPETFELIKEGDNWKAVKEGKSVNASVSSVRQILQPLAALNAKRMVTKDPARYAEYEIDEGRAARITIYSGKKKLADLLVGGFRFDQAARTASSFIKHADQPEVYLIDGFLSMSLKARFDQFRDKKLVKVSAEDLTSLSWSSPGGQTHGFQKIDGAWHYAGMEAVDSTLFSNYLSALINVQGSEFSELESTASNQRLEQLTLTGNNMVEPTVITAFMSGDTLKPFLIQSTANPEAIFLSDSLGLYKRVFSDLRPFTPDGQ
jgi:hypothetical protein